MMKQSSRALRPRPAWLGLFILLLWATQAASTSGSPEAAKAYAECAECHEDTVGAFLQTPHGREAFTKLSSKGCETCHAGAPAHLASPMDKDQRPSMKGLSAAKLSETCQQCHSGGPQAMWDGSRHETRGLSCLDCHSVHSAKSNEAQLKEATAMDTCFACHKDVRAETRRTSHHPIREGKIGCNDCHNPHGSTTPKLLVAASTNDQCYQCHTEKRGPFLWEHAPVREDCTTCHTPHGSNHAKLQKTAVPYLCQQCHSNTRHPGTLYDANTLAGAVRPSNREFNRGCLNCHSAIHGSNHPSGPYLGR
jgi:DmsE family decaheme c-type cytochrome